MRILGISGSLRRDSFNTRLLRAAAATLPPGAELEIWPDLASVPPYNEEDDGDRTPAVVAGLRSAIAEHDAILIATPEYNHSVPGQLKNALDWVSRPHATNALLNKPAAVVGASAGMFGAVWAQAELRKVLKAIGARVVDLDLPVGTAADAFGLDGRLADRELEDRLEQVLVELVEQVRLREERSGVAERVAA
jgi:chromate reductase